jgi:hypothetical protein
MALFSCSGTGTQMKQPHDKAAQPELAQIRTLADVRRHEGKRAEIHGHYRMTPPELESKAHPVNIELEDGTALLRSYESIEAEAHLRDKAVVVIGVVRMSTLVDASGAVSAGIEGPQLTVEKIVAR